MVYLALLTVKGTAADSEMGNTISEIQVVSRDLETDVKGRVRAALSRQTGAGIVRIRDIFVRTEGTRLFLQVDWTDMTSGAELSTIV